MTAMFDYVAENVWALQEPFRVLGVPIDSRMTVVKLGGGDLLLHSPVRLSDSVRTALMELGSVRHVVCPNRFHHLFAADYSSAFGGLKLYGAPGLTDKRRDLKFDEVLGHEAPDAWRSEMDQRLIEGAPMLNEVVFRHRSTRTLIATDLALNIWPDSPFGLRLWARLNGQYRKLGTPIEVRLMFRNRAATRESLRSILAWDFQRIIVGHGRIVTENAKAQLEKALAWTI